MSLQYAGLPIDIQAPPSVSSSSVTSPGDRRANIPILMLVNDRKASVPMTMPARICIRKNYTAGLSGTNSTPYGNASHDMFQSKNGARQVLGEDQIVSQTIDTGCGR